MALLFRTNGDNSSKGLANLPHLRLNRASLNSSYMWIMFVL